jgi:hypothetical protein
MRTSLFIIALIILSKVSFAQQVKKNIDYQYFRDDKKYYAYELYKDFNALKTDQLLLNFTSNSSFKKIEKIYVKTEKSEVKIRFKQRAETLTSDNPELKFYPVTFSINDLKEKNIGCDAQIFFKLDNGELLILPFSMCMIEDQLSKN